MDRSRYKCPEILDFHGFHGVFAVPGAKIVAEINPIAKNDLRAADAKYAIIPGVGGGKM